MVRSGLLDRVKASLDAAGVMEKPNKKGQMSSLRLSIRRLRSQMRAGEKPGEMGTIPFFSLLPFT